MAILGNRPPVTQNAAMNNANMARRTMIPGLTPGRPVPWSQLPQGMMLNTPRDWSQGGLQTYDPRYATADPRTTGQPMWSGGGVGGMAGASKGGGYARPGQSIGTSTPNYGRMNGSTTMPTGGGLGGYFPNAAQIGTSIVPQTIYPQWMTDTAVNQAVANADQRSNLDTLMERFDTPGVSRSSRHAALAAPLAAQSQLTAADARARIPFEDLMANQRNLFLGQVARENEALGLGNLSARMYEAQNQDALSRLGQGLSYLQSLIG